MGKRRATSEFRSVRRAKITGGKRFSARYLDSDFQITQMDSFSAAPEVSSHKMKTRRSSFHLSEWRDWPGLPNHLLFDIADKFTDINDYIQFGSVCVSWQMIFLQDMENLRSPLLIVVSADDKDYYKQRALYNPSTKRVCNFGIQLPHKKICRGSSFGWLITMEVKGDVEDRSYHVQLQNLFVNRTINLPPLDNIVELHPDEDDSDSPGTEYLWKAALSSDPSLTNDFIVVGIKSRYRRLAYLKPGNRCWTSIGEEWILDSRQYTDVIFFHKARRFYALLLSGMVLAIEFQGDKEEPKLTKVAPPLGFHLADGYDEVYLVEDLSSGDLLQVRRREDITAKDENGKRHKLIRFLVFRFDHVEQNWTEIHNLGDKVLFLGSTCSIFRSASDCPGCVPNCIYYTTDPYYARFIPRKFYKPLWDGIYSLEDGAIELLDFPVTTNKPMPLTVWVEPNFRPSSY